MDEVMDVVHEVLVHLACLVDEPVLVSEDVDRKDRKDKENYHEPASL